MTAQSLSPLSVRHNRRTGPDEEPLMRRDDRVWELVTPAIVQIRGVDRKVFACCLGIALHGKAFEEELVTTVVVWEQL